MSKLIYASSLNTFKQTFPDWESNSSSIFKSIAYTNDGYMYTHGKIFQMGVFGDENPYGLNLTLDKQILTVTVGGGTKSISLPLIQVLSGSQDSLQVNTLEGIATIKHLDIFGTQQIIGPQQESSDIISIPKFTVSKSGHVLNSTLITATLNRVKVTQGNNVQKAYITFGQDESTQELKYTPNIYANLFDGSISASSFIQNGKILSEIYAPKEHASNDTIYGVGNNTLYGHLRLSDNINLQSGVSGGYAATPKAVYDAIITSKQYADNILQISDAMLFVGTITGNGVISSYNNNVIKQQIIVNTTNISQLTTYRAGWTFKVIDSGYISGIGTLESGDMIICIRNYDTSFKGSDWTAIQANIDGTITAESLTPNTLIIASGTKSVTSLSNGTYGQYLTISSTGIPEWKSVGVNMRAIKFNNQEFLPSGNSTALNIVSGAGISVNGNPADGTLTISNTGILNTYSLSIYNEDTSIGEYQPKSEQKILKASRGISISLNDSIFTVGHLSSGKSKSEGLYRITIDEYGHVTATSQVTSLPSAQKLAFLNNNGSEIDNYIGSTQKSLKFVNTTDLIFNLATSNNIISVTPTLTHRYRPIAYQSNQAQSPTDLFNDTNNSKLTLKAGQGIDISNNSGILTIQSVFSQRDITAIPTSRSSGFVSIGQDTLQFGSDFRSQDNGTTSSIQLGWAEISSDGTITYIV